MDMVIYPGDPLTPGVGATENAQRLERTQAATILKIPVQPISYHDAQPLLAALEGPVVPADWRGGLPITYHAGPGKATVHLQVECSWDLVPAYDVVATIKGSQYPDEWVIRGNHHDAWVNGAGDPISGLAAMLEEAKSIGALVKSGYQPKRTLVYCAWDGEEPGLIGSTEWVEDHDKELQKKAVAYINTDGNERGFLGMGGSHALTKLMDGIAKDVTDPQTKVSVYERAKAAAVVNAAPAGRKTALEKKGITLFALGSGSDYSPFFQHLGVPSLNLGFGGEGDGGEYHSIYDSYDQYSRFKDPDFSYGVALAQVAGRAALRLADADVLPFDFTDLYKTISGYVKELTDQADQLRESTVVENRLIKEHSYQLAADPKKPFTAPKAKAEVPYLDFSALQNALVKLDHSSSTLADSIAATTITAAARQRLNEALYQAEQSLLVSQGLPKRPWFKHSIYAPGFYTGYGVKTLPGIREALEQRNWKEAQEQIAVVAGAVDKFSAKLDEITGMVK
jgi:N-acetylated-alpha-linked acidic dipeptidase